MGRFRNSRILYKGEKMRILHVASFNGNIGDGANHNGFISELKKYVMEDLEITQLEIRKFYKNWGECSFDDDFVALANKFDLVIFGGGGFFEVLWDYSETGVTINLPPRQLKKIKSKIIFNGLGVKIPKEVGEERIQKFKYFLDYCKEANNILLTVRNDGSLETLENCFGKEYCSDIVKIPDGGFFVKPYTNRFVEFNENEPFVAVNLAGDELEKRFPENSLQCFNEQFSKWIQVFLERHIAYRIVFIPHIMSDYQLIYQVCQLIPDKIVRQRVTVAPYLCGEACNGLHNIGLYGKAEFQIGMRYHSNICSIAQLTPTISLVSEKRLSDLYADMNMTDRCVDVDDKELCDKLLILTRDIINNKEKYVEENKNLMKKLQDENDSYMRRIQVLIDKGKIEW